MRFPLESLASVATIVGTLVSLFALVQSSAWLAIVSLLFAALAIATVLYARQKRLALDAASTVIEGRSIDSLNIANLRRRISRNFVVQEAFHTVSIVGEDMEISWKYTGYCKGEQVSAMEFSIDSEGSASFEELNCVAFDLGHDPEMKHAIRPIPIGTHGLSRKVSVPFLQTLKANEPFAVLLKCQLPRCVTAGTGYYTSTLSFDQKLVARCTVHLIFVGSTPEWVRVYDTVPNGPPELVKSLMAIRVQDVVAEYIDIAEGRKGRSARVYTFWRDKV